MKVKNKAVLVTGGAGFIGSHLIEELITHEPEKIVVIDNFFLGKMENLLNAIDKFGEIKVFREDAAGYTVMENILSQENIDVVFDLAVKPLPYSFLDPEGAFMVSVNIAHVLLSLLRKGLYDTLIHFSSSEAYGTAVEVPMTEEHPLNPTTPYSAGKAAADLAVLSYYRTFGLDTSIVRPFNNYGPRQNDTVYAAIVPITIKNVLAGKKPVLEWDGKQTRDFLYVKDTARAAIKVYENKSTRGKALNIGAGEETRIKDLMDTILRILGYEGEIIKRPKRLGDIRRHCAGIKLAKRLIGFKPAFKLEEGLRETINWYLDNAKGKRR